MLPRAQGCLMGQLIGDSLGSLVEFESKASILKAYPDGVRELANGGPFRLLAGQPTDDSEMALTLARTLIQCGGFSQEAVRGAYAAWYNSKPFDCGRTIAYALKGRMNPDSQANGAMMRVSPLAIWCAGHASYHFQTIARLAREDAEITHVHKICADASALFVAAIVEAIRTPQTPKALYGKVAGWGVQIGAGSSLLNVIDKARNDPPNDYFKCMGWVLIAFHNALYQLLHAPNFEEALVDTVMRGGDTDTNAAICGALLGAVYGLDGIPSRWREAVLNCRPDSKDKSVIVPRPRQFWPVDALELSEKLTR